jgi:hypothetical protein
MLGRGWPGGAWRATDKDVAMIGHWPVETFGRTLWTRHTLQRRIAKLVTSIRLRTLAAAPPSADRRLPGRSRIDRDACHQFQFRNLSDDPYQSLEFDDILESPDAVRYPSPGREPHRTDGTAG